ncbi:MAG: aminoacyl-tRNA hydrolase [Clostridiales bacterium]|nr:aminoacyl-tRNA hydrolase [Clostridiales bacterium]
MLFRKKSTAVDFIITGLGNPGKKYEGTRHNAGFIMLEALAERLHVRVDRVRFQSFCGEVRIEDHHLLLMMPQTYMNASGEAVQEAMRFYRVPPERTLVLFDDISLPVGTLRIRRRGSDGGQKGMRSIITLTGSDQFPRIKLGVGAKPHPDYDLADWVLSRFTGEEAVKIREAAFQAADAIPLILADRMEEAMNRYSR